MLNCVWPGFATPRVKKPRFRRLILVAVGIQFAADVSYLLGRRLVGELRNLAKREAANKMGIEGRAGRMQLRTEAFAPRGKPRNRSEFAQIGKSRIAAPIGFT